MARSSTRPGAVRVAVLGAGVVGLSCALRLKQGGAEVVVYERGADAGAGTSLKAAGMLGAAFENALERENPVLARFAEHAARIWADFAAEIERLGDGDVEFSRDGALVCAMGVEDEGRIEALAAACQARGLGVRWLKTDEARRIEPALTGSIRSAILLPEDRQVEPSKLVQRLKAGLQRIGVGLRFGRSIEQVQVASDGLLLPDGERFDRVLLATGAGQPVRLFDRFGANLPTGIGEIVPVKGQMLALAPVAGAPKHVIRTREVYVAPKERWILVGATVERGAADTRVDPEAIAALRARAGALVGGLADAPGVSSWAAIRPGTMDDAPMIGPTRIPGLHAALGCYRNGILFAPAVAELVAGQMLGEKTGAEARAFSPVRFDADAV